jgi:flagella basal body P-ring formation protein FlgA
MRFLVLTALLPASAMADSVVATRTIRAQSVIAAQDVAMVPAEITGALTATDAAVGLEAKVTLFAGRPVRAADLAAPALIQRNQVVPVVYHVAGLTIRTDGRALERGGAGAVIKVMNLASHLTVQGAISPDGSVRVGPNLQE